MKANSRANKKLEFILPSILCLSQQSEDEVWEWATSNPALLASRSSLSFSLSLSLSLSLCLCECVPLSTSVLPTVLSLSLSSCLSLSLTPLYSAAATEELNWAPERVCVCVCARASQWERRWLAECVCETERERECVCVRPVQLNWVNSAAPLWDAQWHRAAHFDTLARRHTHTPLLC